MTDLWSSSSSLSSIFSAHFLALVVKKKETFDFSSFFFCFFFSFFSNIKKKNNKKQKEKQTSENHSGKILLYISTRCLQTYFFKFSLECWEEKVLCEPLFHICEKVLAVFTRPGRNARALRRNTKHTSPDTHFEIVKKEWQKKRRAKQKKERKKERKIDRLLDYSIYLSIYHSINALFVFFSFLFLYIQKFQQCVGKGLKESHERMHLTWEVCKFSSQFITRTSLLGNVQLFCHAWIHQKQTNKQTNY